jgi:hypothetical protein
MASQIPWMNHAIWVHETNDSYARVLQACYGGEIVSIDVCLRRILDEVDARDAADNTRIFFSVYESAWTIIEAVKRNANANI